MPIRLIYVSIFLFSTILLSLTASAQDYLSADLRVDVERLKREAAAAASTQDTVVERADVLWRWLNAFSLTGRSVPVNATQTVASTNAAVADGFVSLGLMTAIDDFIREFGVRDEQPDAIGIVSVSPEGPFEAESWQTIEVTYALGSLPMRDGAIVVMGRHFMSDTGAWQRDNADEDNYISIRASKAGITFSKQQVPNRRCERPTTCSTVSSRSPWR